MFSVLLLAAGAGCVDPQSRFDEFVNRIPDARVVVMPDAPKISMIPDISGTFLYAIFAAPTPTLPPLQSIATVTLSSSDPPKASFTIQFLKLTDRSLLPGTATYNDIAVDETGSFQIHVDNLLIPAASNALGMDLTAVGVVLGGSIKSKDFFCGSVSGVVQPQGLDLDGSTFGARRVPAGTTGSALPPPAKSCAEAPADAGT